MAVAAAAVARAHDDDDDDGDSEEKKEELYTGFDGAVQPPPPPGPPPLQPSSPQLATLSFECEFGERDEYFVRLHPSILATVTVRELIDSVAALSGIAAADFSLNVGCNRRSKLDRRWTGADIGLCDGVHFGLR